jgi:hypothetical protein
MHKVSSENRTQSIKRVAEQISLYPPLRDYKDNNPIEHYCYFKERFLPL